MRIFFLLLRFIVLWLVDSLSSHSSSSPIPPLVPPPPIPPPPIPWILLQFFDTGLVLPKAPRVPSYDVIGSRSESCGSSEYSQTPLTVTGGKYNTHILLFIHLLWFALFQFLNSSSSVYSSCWLVVIYPPLIHCPLIHCPLIPPLLQLLLWFLLLWLLLPPPILWILLQFIVLLFLLLLWFFLLQFLNSSSSDYSSSWLVVASSPICPPSIHCPPVPPLLQFLLWFLLLQFIHLWFLESSSNSLYSYSSSSFHWSSSNSFLYPHWKNSTLIYPSISRLLYWHTPTK